jgi:NAD-dependent SIR2 family protein deacetylase
VQAQAPSDLSSLHWHDLHFLQEFYGPIAKAQPHPGHFAIAQLEEKKFGRERMTIVTMNVDGFHSR